MSGPQLADRGASARPVQTATTAEDLQFDRLFALWMPTVLGWCKRLGGPTVQAEDAAHDVFLVVMRRLPGLRDPSRLSAWLFGITRRVLASHRRRAWVRRWVPGARRETADPRSGADDRAAAVQLLEIVHAAILELPETYATVLVLCELEERSVAEVAQILDVPRETVKTRRRRARERLRRRLGPEVREQLGWGGS